MTDGRPVILHRRDTTRHMARFYHVIIQPALPFDDAAACDLVREWGRIGQNGRVRADGFASAELAQQAADQLTACKRRRGYR
jgi:predicted DNA-binding WGR domain protein